MVRIIFQLIPFAYDYTFKHMKTFIVRGKWPPVICDYKESVITGQADAIFLNPFKSLC